MSSDVRPDVIRDILRTPAEVVDRAAAYPSSILADVAGRRGALHGRIQGLSPSMRFAGTALTVEVRPGDNLMIHAAMALAQPGDVLVVDGKGDLSSALMGEIMSQQCVALGIAESAATHGVQVVAVKLTAGDLEAPRRRIQKGLDRRVERGKLSAEARDAIMGRIQFSSDLASLRDAEIVIES